jgi:hypothetical protein
MPEIIACPGCQTRLQLPDSLKGKQVRCPTCGIILPAHPSGVKLAPASLEKTTPPPGPVTDPPVEEADATLVDEAPAPPQPAPAPAPAPPPAARAVPRAEPDRARDERELRPPAPPAADQADAWRSVRSGLTLHLIAHALYVGGVAGVFLCAAAVLTVRPAAVAPGNPPEASTRALITILAAGSGFLLLANWVLSAIGHTFWLMAPPRHNARALAAVTLLMAGLFLVELPYPMSLAGGNQGGGLVQPYGVTLVLTLLAVFEGTRLTVFPLFLAAVVRNCAAPRAALPCRLLAIVTPCMIAVAMLVDVLFTTVYASGPAARSGPGLWPLLLLALFNFGGLLFLLVCGLAVLFLTRRAVDAALTPVAVRPVLENFSPPSV